MSQLSHEYPEMTHPLLSDYRAPAHSASVYERAAVAQATYESLPRICPECGNDNPDSLVAEETPKGVPAWICWSEEDCFDRQDATSATAA